MGGISTSEYLDLVKIWKDFEEDSMKDYKAEEIVLNMGSKECRECYRDAQVVYMVDGMDSAYYCKKCADDLGIEYLGVDAIFERVRKAIDDNRNNYRVRRSCFDGRMCYCAPFEESEKQTFTDMSEVVEEHMAILKNAPPYSKDN